MHGSEERLGYGLEVRLPPGMAPGSGNLPERTTVMAKRFKKFCVQAVPGDAGTYDLMVAYLDGDYVRFTDETGDTVEFSISQWEHAARLVQVEDVPEPKSPGQRLYEDAVPQSCRLPWEDLTDGTRISYENRAARLGILPEGEE